MVGEIDSWGCPTDTGRYLLAHATHFVLPRTEHGGGEHAMVKEGGYFRESRGITSMWGQSWIPVMANGIDHARLLAWIIAQGIEHPSAVSFSPQNRLTVGALRAGELTR